MCRDLKASEIEVRVQSIMANKTECKGAILLLYKNARVDMDILDETFGKYGWQRAHAFKDGRLYCTVSVWDKEKEQWISREDVGTESNTEAEKGQASDAFKRACTNFGSGRELYTSPSIFINASDFNPFATDYKDKKGNTVFQTKDTFSVSNIVIEKKVITGLEIKNDKTHKVVFTFGKCKGQNKDLNSSESKSPEQERAKNENEPKNTPDEPKNEEQKEQMTLEQALDHVIEVTSCAGMKLRDVYADVNTRKMINSIWEQGCAKTKLAIEIAQAEIKRKKEAK